MRRRVVEFEHRGTRAIGTLHEPPAGALPASWGFVSFNWGQAPRAGHGDLAAKLGDLFASLGVPAFRFDAPGLGDTPGELPMREDHYWQGIERGAHTEFGGALLDRLCSEHGLTDCCLAGLCGGGVTAIRVAASKPERTRGLCLLEPTFLNTRTPEELRAQRASATKDLQRDGRTLRRRLLSPQAWLRLVTGRSQGRHHLRVLWRLLGRRLAEAGLGSRLPEDSNHEAIALWRQLLAHGIPSLVLTADQGPLQAQVRRVVDFALRPRERACVRTQVLPRTNHTFGTGDVHPLVLDAARDWAQLLQPGT